MSEIDFTQGAAKEALDKAVAEATSGLKTKNEDLLGENKKLKETAKKFEGVDADEYKRLKEEARSKGEDGKDAKEIRARVEAEFNPRIEALEKDLKTEREARRNDRIDSSLTEALVGAKVSNDLLGAAKDHLLKRRKVDVGDDGVTIDGKPVNEFAKSWVTSDGKAFVGALDNSGGGSKPGGGGGANTKKASEMSRGEKVEFIKEHGQEAWTKLVQESHA